MKTVKTRLIPLCASALIGLAAACSDGSAPTGPIEEMPAPAHTVTVVGDGFTRVEGSIAGALFAVIRPHEWNGDLVLLLHGSVSPDAPLSLEPPLHWWWNPVIDALVERGFGVAFSSYRVNGYAVREGTIDSRIVQALFWAEFGKPRDTYLIGWSLGSHIGQKLVENSFARYSGFLSVCGILGGSPLQVARYANARIVFDYFFPGVLPGNVLTADFDFLAEGLPLVIAAITNDFPTAMKLASIDQLYIQWSNPQELVFGIVGSLFGFGGGDQDLLRKARGVPFDNTGTVYTSALLTPAELEALNAGVGRFRGDRNALRYIKRNYAPDGRFRRTKILSLHTANDPLVSIQLHGPAYAQVLAAAGNQDLHVLRIIDGFGHCEFGFDAQPDPFLDFELAAFDDLVAWVRQGVKPAS